jgi:hypothetical protein
MNLLAAVLTILGSLTGVWPLNPPPEIIHSFQPPSQLWSAGHRGVDLRGEIGQEVLAGAPGTVTFAGRIAGIGIVVISHGEERTTYQPVAASVVRGQVVLQGQPIGRLELLGSHCLPVACLHWGLLRGTEYLDPLMMVEQKQRVRLLPLDAPPEPAPGTTTDSTTVTTTVTTTGASGSGAGIQELAEVISAAISAGLAGGFPLGAGPLTPSGAPAGTPTAAGPP